uniref:Uncharacterized protein n=1 Tax=Arundo donax TaxID=35708 RepID=A0A0A8YU27_ARUDO
MMKSTDQAEPARGSLLSARSDCRCTSCFVRDRGRNSRILSRPLSTPLTARCRL